MSRVLIVEDNDLNLGLMRYLLRAAGHDCIEASNGRSGVELARTSTPDVVLMDLHMPELDGYGALEAIRSDPVLRRLPVVAITAYSMKGDRERALDAGFDGYISKPIDPRAFAETVAGFATSTDARGTHGSQRP